MKIPKILIFAPFITQTCLARRHNKSYLTYSGQKKVWRLSGVLESIGYGVDICSTSYAKRIDRPFVERVSEGIRVIHGPTIGFQDRLSFFKRSVGTAYNLVWLIRHRKDYVLILFYNYHVEFSLPSLLAKRVFNLPIVMDYEDGLFLDKGYQGGFYGWLERSVYTHADGFILVNPGLKGRIRKILRHERPWIVVPGLLDMALLSNRAEGGAAPIQDIAFSGNFNRSFGLEELLRVIENLPDGFTLHITGRAGPEEEALLMERIGRSPNVRFYGYLEEKDFESLMGRMDAFLLIHTRGSHFNQTNFPSKFFDYLSRNRMVLSFPNPLLEPYRGLEHLRILERFPGDLLDLTQRLRDGPLDKAELYSLHEETLCAFRDFLSRVIKPRGGEGWGGKGAENGSEP